MSDFPFDTYLNPELYPEAFAQLGYKYGRKGDLFYIPQKLTKDECISLLKLTNWREMVSGNIFIRRNRLAKVGDFIKGHKHNFDHTSFVYKGAVKVELLSPIDGVTYKSIHPSPYFADKIILEDGYKFGPHHFFCRARVHHLITALADDTEFDCVYAHRNGANEIVQTYEDNLTAHFPEFEQE